MALFVVLKANTNGEGFGRFVFRDLNLLEQFRCVFDDVFGIVLEVGG